MHDGVDAGRLLSGKHVGFPVARVPSASFDVLQFLQFPKSTTGLKKKTHARQITIGYSHLLSHAVHEQQLTAFYGGC
jgi:hypothetical protein